MKKITTPSPRVFRQHLVKAIASLGVILSLLLTAAFFSTNVHAQGGGLWQANGSLIVFTNRDVGIKTDSPTNDFDVNGSFRSRSAFIDSVLNTWQIIVADALSVGGNLSVSGNSQLNGLVNVGSALTLDGTNSSISSTTGTVDFLNSNITTTGSINASQYLINGFPLTNSQWTSSGSNIFYSGGNVGINTSNPSLPLEVDGSAAITGTLFVDRIEAQSNISIGQFRFINGATQPGQADTIRSAAEIVMRSETERIALKADTVTVKERLGVGVEKPTVALDVAGDIRTTGSLTAKTLNVSGAVFDSLDVNGEAHINGILTVGPSSIVLDGTVSQTGPENQIYTNNGDLKIQSTGTFLNTIISQGNFSLVGIGTTSPSKKLHVRTIHGCPPQPPCPSPPCPFIPCPEELSHGGLRLEDENLDVSGLSIWDIVPDGGTGKLHFLNPSKTVMTFADTGNVGIGTTSPGAKLSVSGGGTFGSTYANSTMTDGDVAISGNVGIGTTTPAQKLDVEGNIELNHHLVFNSGSIHGVINWPESGNLWFRTNSTPGDISFSSYTDRMIITGAGKVGIGTVSPFEKLHVAGNVNIHNRLFVRGGSGWSGSPTITLAIGDNDSGIDWVSDGNLAIYSNNVERIRIANNGNVGIGTTSPAFKLDVCGTIRSNRVVVETGWCDYVFEDGYKLMSLPELEKYIKQNKRLPGFPSTEEIEKNGADLGEITTLQQVRMEENTVHLIDHNKRIDVMEQHNKEKDREIELLKEENKELKEENQEIKAEMQLFKQRLEKIETKK